MVDESIRLRELRAFVQQLLRVQHEERVRIAEWLHEQVMQDLFVARFNLEFSLEDFSPEQVAGVHKDLLQIIHEMRGLSYDLYPRVVTVPHLAEMLQDCAEMGEHDWAMPVALQANPGSEGISVPPEVHAALFHILQESLDNAAKHGRAGQVQVALDLQADRVHGAPCMVHLEIVDDGLGFELPNSLETWIEEDKLGLISMRERAIGLGGTWHLTSKPGKGTRISVEVPLPGS